MDEKKIVEMLKELYSELNETGLSIATGEETDYSKKLKLRKDIARLQTILREKTLIAQYANNKNNLEQNVNEKGE